MAVARQWDRHSQLVFWLKILLPLTALGILSTLFLVSHTIRPEDAIPYANVDVATLIKEPRLTAPVFAGMTADGAALSLKASEAKVGSADGIMGGKISNLVGLLETPDGGKTNLTAAEADLDQTSQVALLSGGVQVSNSTGYRIDSQAISVALDQTSVDSPGSITADGPVGKITAGSMHIGLAAAKGAGYVLLFKGGVTLLYLPSKQRAEN
jgi:lipopolysaccharide export system protein LptC